MRRAALDAFLAAQVAEAREQGVLFSVHLKATMMKVSDPIIFGHAVRAYFADVFADHGDALARVGANPNNGLASVLSALEALPGEEREAIEAAVARAYEAGPALAMVDSDRGITNLHVPSDVIIDASMPAMIRTSGQMWNAAGEQQDTKAVIPDSSYAALYAETIDFCRERGAFDPATMGTVPNVGLMAQKAEEYGSHDKTFEIEAPGTVRVVDGSGATLLEHEVAPGDIWRGCQTKDAAVADWVALAVRRARETGAPAVFWLDSARAHDQEILRKVERELAQLDTDGLGARDPARGRGDALHARSRGARRGHHLRDRQRAARLPHGPLPDPRAGHEREDALDRPAHAGRRALRDRRGRLRPQARAAARQGEPPALGLPGRVPRPRRLARAAGREDRQRPAEVLATALDAATGTLLERGQSPSRSVGELDNRGSHFHLAQHWARALAGQEADGELAARFAPLADRLDAEEEAILAELAEVQGRPVELGGYYFVDAEKADAVMRPSSTFNAALGSL